MDLKNAVSLLKPLIVKTKKFFKGPVTLACAPTDTSDAERTPLRSALVASGASRVSVIPEILAAAVGAGIDITEPTAQLIIDISEGVTDLAVFREGRIAFSSAIRVACADIHKAIRSSIMARHKIKIYGHEIERLTNEISAIICEAESRPRCIRISGIDVGKRCEASITIDHKAVTDAILPVIGRIIGMIDREKPQGNTRAALLRDSRIGHLPDRRRGMLKGMDRLIAAKTGMAVKITSDPLHAVINGAVLMLKCWNGKKSWWDNIAWPRLALQPRTRPFLCPTMSL